MQEFNLWYSFVKLSSFIKLNLIKKYNSTEEIWYYGIKKNNLEEFKDNKIKDAFIAAYEEEKIKSLLYKMEKEDIHSVMYNDNLYPENLRHYDEAPSVLFYKGDIKPLTIRSNVAVVGARNCTHYGRNVGEIICRELAENHINIISGMARGIDAIAHNSCLKSLGYTCAVLGCGIDIIYPRENSNIYKEIFNKGCILSEFPPGTPPLSYNFPIRNRIISGLSDLIIVVEADIKSGSLITANTAINQGKDVMAVPGSIFSSRSKGTNKLIKDGAYPLTSIEDIFNLLGENIVQKPKKNNVRNTTKYDKIHEILSDSPMHIDDIMKLTNIDIEGLYGLLFEMQIDSQIKCIAGNYYVKVNGDI